MMDAEIVSDATTEMLGEMATLLHRNSELFPLSTTDRELLDLCLAELDQRGQL